jgi:two-component system cell cycle response regulator
VTRARTSSVETLAAGALPSPPAIVLRIVQHVSSSECSVVELGKLISNDPALSAALLHSVNSAFFRPKQKVGTVQRAIALLGLQAVRNLVLCIAARGLFEPPEGFPINRFWEVSLRRGASAKLLAHHAGLRDPDELFTLGLLQDIGVLTAAAIHPHLAGDLAALLDRPNADRIERERELGVPHDTLGHDLLAHWHLDEGFIAPLRQHHTSEDGESRSRAQILAAADAIADLVMVDDKLKALAEIERNLDSLSLDRALLAQLLQEIDETTKASAEMLGVAAGQQPELSAVMASAAAGLADVTMGYQQLVQTLEASLERERALAAQLEEANRRLQVESVTDPLTELPNRRGLDQQLQRTVAQARRQQAPLTLLMLDADHFKRVNDTHGHAAGDLVLKKLALTIERALRQADFLARVGGEEFVAVLPFTPLEGAEIAAERIRACVEELEIAWEETTLKVTISVGCAAVSDFSDAHATELTLRRVDDALYKAKSEGRNRVVVAD